MSTSKHQSLEELVSKGKTKEAIKLLLELIDNLNGVPRETLLILQNRHRNKVEKDNQGITNSTDSNIELNNITKAFLNIHSDIKDLIQQNLSIYKPIPLPLPESDSKTNTNTLLNFLQTALTPKIDKLKSFKPGTDFINFTGITKHAELEVMIRVLKSSDPSHIENNPYFKNILQLKHRNLIQILEINFHTYPYYIITEFIHGLSLKELLKEVGPLPLHSVKRLLYTIGDVMNTMRKKKLPLAGLRPSKIFIDYELELEISPFYLFINTDKKRLFKSFREDCYYFSPETIYNLRTSNDSGENDKSNQFCLATLAYEMLTGQKLFEGETVDEILFKRKQFFIDENFRKSRLNHERLQHNMPDILEKLLQENPKDRYANILVALKDIMEVEADLDKDELEVFNSYRRCLDYSDNFEKLFYANLFSVPEMQSLEPKTPEDIEELERKFYKDLILLFDVENAVNSLERMATLEKGEINPLSEYKIFMQVLFKSIKECDPLWTPNSTVEKAWISVRKRIFEGLGNPLPDMKIHNNHTEKQTNHTIETAE